MNTTAEVSETVTATTPQLVDGPAGLGAQAAPWAAMGALVVAAAACRVAVNVTGAEQETALTVAGVAFAAAVVTAWATRRRITDRRMRHRFVAALYLAAGWLATVTATGLTLGAVAALTIFGCGLSLLWWREHRIGPGDASQQNGNTNQPLAPYQARWLENIAGNGGTLPGSQLTHPETIKSGIRFVGQLRPGQQTLEMVQGSMSKVRGGLRLRRDQELIVEGHPTEPEPAILVTVVTRSPIKKATLWPGPSAFNPSTGRVDLGPFADGEGTASWRAYVTDRMLGGFIQGGSNCGKSRTIDSLALSLAASSTHPTVIWYGDGQEGGSSPMLMEYADLFAGTGEDIYEMFAAADRIMKVRIKQNKRMRVNGFTPTEDRPGLLLILDECHIPLMKEENPDYFAEVQRIASIVARAGQKVGVAAVLATQDPYLTAFGPASAQNNHGQALRSNLLIANGIMMKGEIADARNLFRIAANPQEFPALPGYGFIACKDPDERKAPYRGFFLDDSLRATWPKRIRWRGLDPVAAAAAGTMYGQRAMSYEDRLASTEPPGMSSGGPAAREVIRVSAPIDTLAAFGGVTPPSWRELEAKLNSGPPALSPGQQRVLDAIRAGHSGPKALREATGYSESRVHTLLDDLQALEAVRRLGHGRYELAEQAA
ncbi:hypothetical protein [Micromonospora rubida]